MSYEICSYHNCNAEVNFFNSKKCKFCHNLYCFDHIQLENHECVKTVHVKYLRKDWLRKYELNISSGQYKVACDQCGFQSDFSLIDSAGEQRESHIQTQGCDGSKVFLEGAE